MVGGGGRCPLTSAKRDAFFKHRITPRIGEKKRSKLGDFRDLNILIGNYLPLVRNYSLYSALWHICYITQEPLVPVTKKTISRVCIRYYMGTWFIYYISRLKV